MRHPPLRLSRLLSSTASQQVMETKAKLEMDLKRKIGVNSKTIAIMKKMIKNLMLVAVAAMGFTACNDSIEEATRPIEPAEVEMTITADVDETRTWIDEANSKVQWSEDDHLKVIENGATYRTTTETTIENDKAKFTVSFPANTDATEFTYNAIYPASRVTEDDAEKMDMTKIKVTLPDAQTPTATSFDPTADILVAKQIVTDAQPTELSMQFKRLVAMGKMTLTNLPESSTISKVIFTVEDADAEEQPALAGRNYVDATTGTVQQYGYYGATNTITLNYNEPISTRDIYFTCNPFELVAGDKFTVKVVCSDATYTREITLPRELKFIEGDLSKFSVNMKDATKETNFVFPDGEYAAIAVVSNKYYALSSEANGKRLNAVDVEYTPGESLASNNATLKWTITKTDSGYTFKGSNNQYIAWNSGNYAHTQTEIYYLDITEDADNAGRYAVTSKVDPTRKLQKNKDNTYFAFYTSAQSGSLYLVPVVADTTPQFEVTPNQDQTIAADGGSIEFTVEALNGAVVSATSSADWLTLNGYIATATANNTGANRSATITFSAEGCDDVKVNVSQDAQATGEDTNSIKYTKITSLGELTDGEYIIVYENGNNAYVYNGKDAVNGYTDATVSNGSITTDEAFAGEVTIAAMSGGYSLKVAGGYMYGTSGSNKLNFNSTTAQVNTISFENDGSAKITSNTSVLRFNAASNQMRFRYYKSSSYSSQKAVALYKKN